jgi:hypothetical protein
VGAGGLPKAILGAIGFHLKRGKTKNKLSFKESKIVSKKLIFP